MKKFLNLTVSLALGLSTIGSLAGCGPQGSQYDETKTQLFVGFVNGGFGEVWLNTLSDRFEDLYKDVPFEDGKMGVEIIPHPSKTDYVATRLEGKLDSNGQDVMFVESWFPYELNSDKILDITDAVTTPLTEFGENKSIQDKLTPEYVKAFKDENNKYNALPWYEGYYGIMYDVDLFDKETLYFAPDSNEFINDLSEEKSYGPNGRTGIVDGKDYSFDDGLPATYEQFFVLCDELVSRGIIPCIWSGEHVYETNKTVMGLHVDYEGAADASLNMTYSGTAHNLIEVDANGNITKRGDVEINASNGYELMKQAGRYYALQFAEKLVDNADYYHWLSFSGSNSHTGAQEEFLYSSYSSKKTPIAMLLDGVWWENEADDIFKSMETGGYGQAASRKNRKFGFMPFPKATADKVGEDLTVANMATGIIVNGNIANYKVDLAKKFVRFLHTDASLKEFSKITSVMRPFNYTLAETDLQNLSYFGKSLVNVHNIASQVVLNGTSQLYVQNQAELILYENYTTKIDSLPYVVPFSTFNNNNISAKDYYLNGLSDWTATTWAGKYSKFF